MLLGGTAWAADADAETSGSLKDTASYEVYGIIAMQAIYRDYDTGDKTKDHNLGGGQLNNESRIGFRGKKQFKHFEPTFIWQIEAGYVDPGYSGDQGSTSYEQGANLGQRDTFVGFEHDSFGLIRVGRVLTPLYELVDWPASNPGLGDVYDWGGAIGGAKYQDRQSNTIRWDSPTYYDALSFDVGAGAGDKAASGEGDDFWFGATGHYKAGPVQFDLAYEGNRDIQSESKRWDNDTYLLGMQGWFDNGISFFAQYKYMKASAGSIDEKQDAISTGLMYTVGDWQYKLAYAKNFELERDSKTIKGTDDDVLSAQVMYFVDPSAVLYVRARTLDFGKGADKVDGSGTRGKSGDFDELSVGVEYYF